MIPLVNLPALHDEIRPEIDTSIARVVDSGIFLNGPETKGIEDEFGAWLGGSHVAAVSSGAAALQLLLQALGIGHGDEVIAPSLTFVATVAAIVYTGATPILVDVDSVSRCIDPAEVEASITPQTRAILAVHLHGYPADMDALRRIAKTHDVLLVEDAAQAHGASIGDTKCGLLGDAAAFSFYPGKNLGSIGEGGAVVSRDAELIAHIRALRDWGSTERYVHSEFSYAFRMHEIQAAVLRAKLPHLDSWNERRERRASEYQHLLSGQPGIILPSSPPHGVHCHHVYGVEVDLRNELAEYLAAREITTSIHYPIPVHRQLAYQNIVKTPRSPLSVTDALSNSLLSLPLCPATSENDVNAVCSAVGDFLSK